MERVAVIDAGVAVVFVVIVVGAAPAAVAAAVPYCSCCAWRYGRNESAAMPFEALEIVSDDYENKVAEQIAVVITAAAAVLLLLLCYYHCYCFRGCREL